MPRTLSEPEISQFRERLCETAADIFATRGREAFNMRELASAMGVSAMTPYRYFRDKDEILAAVRARAFDRFAEALETAFGTPGDAGAKSYAVGRAYIGFAFSEPSSYRLMFDLSQSHGENYPELVRAEARARLTMTRHIFWAVLHGAVMLEFAAQLTPDCDFDRLVQAAIRALSQSFAAKPRASG